MAPPPAQIETPSLGEFRAAVRLLFEGLDQSMVRRIAAANALALAGGALAGLAPVALKQMIDAASSAGSALEPYPSIAGFGIAYLGCLGISRLITETRPLLIGTVEQGLYARLRLRYFKHLLDLPLSFHLARRAGALNHSLLQAVSGYQIILFSLVNGLVPVLVEGVTVGLVLISLGLPALTASFAMTALALSVAISPRMGRLRADARAVSRATIDAHSHLADSLTNYEPIKCFGAEPRTLDRFAQLSRSIESCWRQLQRTRLAIGLTVTLIFTLSVAASLAISIHAVSQGALTVGGFVLANLYMLQIIRPMEMLSSAVRDVSQGLAFVRPLIEILQAPVDEAKQRLPANIHTGAGPVESDATDTDTDTDTKYQAAAVSFRGVQLAFDAGPPVLDGLNLEVPAGRAMAIVGASGCGKSSLVRLLLRLLEPDAGSIAINGILIDTLAVTRLRSMIAVVPQDLVLFNDTISANIGLGRDSASPSDIEEAARLAGLHSFIAALPGGYDTAIGERGLKLSGGERQRIAIARAILKNPLVYVFDEATSMLDGPTERAILQNIKQISSGRTTLTIAHRLSAIQHADEIAVLADGKIVERGSHTHLLGHGGVYAAMWREHQAAQSITP
ncbi:ABC transporter ATP-binding protein [Paucibacter sp. PLA-PC-4]|uniref:ABC transporter transmembrane domain-containing protein n=1 Tax=Paucibacter sp. PLA-PC-4 TaxID=2993655 RepID=UPI00224B467D|nr:ABC transporter ATP-binding protein [Paucibacter sp. PLA-PC-4]MCX2864904.1 ABC transporter ATP-binding protein [Paucibacter sp. PLA-PC-4]